MAAPISMGEMKCSLSNFSSISCGYHRNYLKELIITKISECNRDITSHIRRYKLNSCDVKSEGHLICFRGGLFQFENFETWTICPAHRYSLGLQWRPQYKKCMYPYHSGGRRPTRTVGVAMSHHLLQTTGHLVPIGSGLCTQCVNLWNKLKATASEQQNESNIPDIDEEETRVASEEPRPQTSLIEVTSTSASYGGDLDSEQYSYSEDQSQTCSQLSNWSTEENIPLDKINNFIQYMGGGSVSPLKSQLSKPLDDCTGKTQSYYKRKAEEVFQLVSEGIAPGQGKVLSETVLGTNKTENEEVENETENCIMKLYEESSDGSVKTQLLSLIANKYKKKYLLNKYPVLTKFAIDKARKFAASGEIQDNTTKFRQKMSPQQIEHALDFFSNPTFNQVLAFGNKTLKLESGEKLEIPCVVRTSLHSNMISIYNKYCLETNFNPLSKSTLYNILNVCSASKQKSMKGLDNIASDGAYGFDSLENIVEKLDKTVEWKKEIKLCLRQSKTYLKSEFKLHIKDNSECPDHCLSWALSDENTKFRSTCQHEHNVSCNFCDLLKSTTDSICTAVQDLTDKKEEIETDFKRAVENVTEWKAHIMRTVNQDRGRQELLETMKPNQVLVIMDWAMKFLPMFFREKQKDWFGQKGRHWHVIVVIHKDEAGNYKHRTFTHVMDMVKQDYYAVASLLEHVLASLRVQLPEVDEAFLRSDNAACYHSGFLWTILPDISSRTEIKIRRFDYSEPQSGKSYCDAKIAHMRLKMRMFVAEKHDVTTAAEM